MITDVRYLKIINTTNEKIDELCDKIFDERNERTKGLMIGIWLFLLSAAVLGASIYYYIWFFTNHDPSILEKEPYWGFTLFPGGAIPLAGAFFAVVFGYKTISIIFGFDEHKKDIIKYKKEIEDLKNTVIGLIKSFSQDFENELNKISFDYDDDYFDLNEYNYSNSNIKYLCDQNIDNYIQTSK